MLVLEFIKESDGGFEFEVIGCRNELVLDGGDGLLQFLQAGHDTSD
jgi:hypothetical protein